MDETMPRRVAVRQLRLGDRVAVLRRCPDGLDVTRVGTIAESAYEAGTSSFWTAQHGLILSWGPGDPLPHVTLLSRMPEPQPMLDFNFAEFLDIHTKGVRG